MSYSVGECGLDPFGLEQSLLVDSGEHRIEPSGCRWRYSFPKTT